MHSKASDLNAQLQGQGSSHQLSPMTSRASSKRPLLNQVPSNSESASSATSDCKKQRLDW